MRSLVILHAIRAVKVPFALGGEGRSPVDGLWFVGFPWLRVRGSGVIELAAEDSAFICRQVVARLAKLPA